MLKIYTNGINKIFLITERNWYIKFHRLVKGVLQEGTPEDSQHPLFLSIYIPFVS